MIDYTQVKEIESFDLADTMAEVERDILAIGMTLRCWAGVSEGGGCISEAELAFLADATLSAHKVLAQCRSLYEGQAEA